MTEAITLKPLTLRFSLALIVLIGVAGCRTTPQAKEARFLERAQSMIQARDYGRAILELRNAIQAMPKDAEPYYRLGSVELQTGDLAGAAAALRKATELNPKHVQAQLKLAQLMVLSRNKGLVEDASNRLKEILAASPNNLDAVDTLAAAEFQLSKPEEAMKRLEEVSQKFPAHLQSSVELSRLKLRQNDPDGAEAVLRKAVASAPGSAEAAVALGTFYMLRERLSQAEPEIRRALSIKPKYPAALLALARLQIAGHRMDEAEQTYRQISQLPDKQYRPMHALFLYQQGKKDAAVAEFEKLRKDDPEDRGLRSRLIALYTELNRVADADKLLAAALKHNSNDADALFQRSVVSLRAGKPRDAEQDLKSIIHLDQNSARAHFALAVVYDTEGLQHNQRDELNAALRLDPSLFAARRLLVRSYLAGNQGSSALEVLNQAPAAQKNTLQFVIERNWALLSTGDTKQVRTTLDAALKVARPSELVLQDGVTKLMTKDYLGARTAADELLAHNPADARAAQLLVRSYLMQDQPENAIRRVGELVSAHPKSEPLQYLLGQLLLSHGDLEKARAAFEAAKAADGKSLQSDLALAAIDQRQNRLDAARQRLEAIVQADPRSVLPLLELAGMDEAKANRAGAIAKYRTVLERESSNLVALNNLAYHLVLDDPDEALKYAQQAAGLAPDNPSVLDTLGWIYYRKGIYHTATDYLKMAVARQSTPRRLFHLAMCYIKSGDRELGEKTLGIALQQDPNLYKTEQSW